tara:strand:+ start:57 stop:1229 length:1173 start_codon:yes stop_codon:yes gene_type:complete
MNIILQKTNKLIPYHNNPRKNQAVDKVASSIKEFGWQQPIVVDESNVIVVGHTRYQAAQKLGLKEVPTHIAKGLTESQIKAYRLLDNRANQDALWDDEMLKIEIKGLEELNADLNLTGFTADELNKLLFEENKGLTDEDEIPELSEETVCKQGDIWQLGSHKLICGDSTKNSTFKNLFNENKADLLMTDPPYNVDYESKSTGMKIKNDDKSDNEFLKFLSDSFANCADFLKLGGSFYIFHSDWYGLEFRQSVKNSDLELKQNLIWEKNSLVMGRQDYQWQHEPCLYGWKKGGTHTWYSDRKQTTIIKYDKPSKSKLHPTMKPVGLIEYFIKNSSKQEDIVLDSFLGSGSTLIACEKQGRICYGIELDPRYADVIINRWQNFTGQKAEKIN